MSKSKKPQPDFVIRMVGGDVRPWIVPMRTLTRALQAVQRILDPSDGYLDELEEDATLPAPGESVLHLIGLSARSAGYSVASAFGETAIHKLRLTGRALDHPDEAQWTPSLVSSIADLSEVARSLGCEIELRLPGEGATYGEVLATIKGTTFDDIVGYAYARGHSSVYARIERVGGATDMHCGIRIPKQARKMVICRVANAELVRELGKHIYEYVVLSGEVEWIRHGWIVRRMTVKSFEPPKTGSIMQSLERIHRAGGSAWDDIEDPESKLSEVRGE